ncbi:hypothetical protein ABIA30_001796 [Mycobacterium sp. MAA66]
MTSEQKIHRDDASPRTSRARLRSASDVIVICCAVGVGQLVFAVGNSPAGRLNYTAVSVTLATLWITLVTMGRGVPQITRRTTEYLTLAAATLQVFGVIAIGSLVLHVDVAFEYLALTLLLGLGALLCTCWMWRHVGGHTAPAWKSATSRNPL